jgi:hypothetical protein
MIQFKEFKIDFDHLEELDDLQIGPSKPNPELDKAFSEFLKAHRAKEARSKAARPIPSRAVAAGRKKAKAN